MNPEPAFAITSQREAGRVILYLRGIIDENANLTPLATAQGTEIWLDLSGVQRINSFGVRAWLAAVRCIPPDERLVFTRCSTPVIDQCNMVSGFQGHAVIESFYAPMICEHCDEQIQILFNTAACATHGALWPEVPCPRCHETLTIDDLEEQYLVFLRGA